MKRAVIAASLFALSVVAGYGTRTLSWTSPAVSTETAPPGERTAEEPRPDPEPPSPDRPTLERALARVPRVDYAPSRSPIWGRVRTIDGAAVRGARIEAWPIPWIDEGSSFEDRVKAWAEEKRAESERRIETTTDESGHFELASLQRADYRMVASHDSWTIFRETGTGELVWPGSYVAFVARSSASVDVEVRVLSIGGRELEEAFITMRPTSPGDWPVISSDPQLRSRTPIGRAFHWTPSNRRLRVSVACELTAQNPDGSASDTVVVSPEEPPREVVLRFAEGRGLLLETVYPEGCEKTVVRTGVLLIDANRPPTVPRFARAAKWTDHYFPLSDAPSRIVEDIPAGTYMVGVTLGKKRESEMSFGHGRFPSRGGVVDACASVRTEFAEQMRFRRDCAAQHDDPTGRAQLCHLCHLSQLAQLAHRSDCSHRSVRRQARALDPRNRLGSSLTSVTNGVIRGGCRREAAAKRSTKRRLPI